MRRTRIKIGNQDFEMHPSKALLWKNDKTLILSDLNTREPGKNGIWSDVKRKAIESNFQQLYDLIHYYEPEKIYFLGDLFSAEEQYEWVRLNILMERFRNIKYHQINNYNAGGIKMGCFNKINVEELLTKDNIIISYKPLPELNGNLNICGFLNPGFRTKKRRSAITRCSCFVYSRNHFILPSFSTHPALNYFEPGDGQKIYCIKGRKIKSIKS